jgi:hypothetical protein
MRLLKRAGAFAYQDCASPTSNGVDAPSFCTIRAPRSAGVLDYESTLQRRQERSGTLIIGKPWIVRIRTIQSADPSD